MSVVTSPAPRIPDYELIRLIGGGSYGDVWLARGITGAFRAVKIVWRDRFPNPRPFAREFEGITRFAAVSLREPSQLALLHAGRDDAAGMFYYVMELADDAEHGRVVDPATYRPLTLREVQSRRGRLPVGEVIALGVSLARALASLHAAGLVHRDVKQSNVIFVGGVPKLADVGLVTSASAPEVTFVGTEGFVPPEGPGAPPADVFGLGKLLYELATGVDRTEFPRLPPEFAQWTDRREFMELNEVLLRACEGDARRRFADAGALLDELLLLQAGKSVRRMRRIEARMNRAMRVAAGFAIVAAIAGGGAWIERQRANSEMRLRAAAEAERDALARRSVYAARLTQAQQALERDDFGRARRFLAECAPAAGEPDLRGFEWQALQTQAAGDPARVLQAGEVAGVRVDVSPDGRRVVALVGGSKLRVWSLADDRLERTIERASGLAGFSPDGRWILGTGAGGRLMRWAVEDGRADGEGVDGIYAPLGWRDERCAWTLVADTDGRVLALRCWSFAEGKVEADIPLAERLGGRGYFGAAMAADGSAVVLATRLNRASEVGWRLHVWRLADLALVREWETPHRPTALAVEDGRVFCGWGDTGEVEAFRASDGVSLWRAALGCPPTALAVRDGRLAVGARASSVWVLEASGGAVLRQWRGLESDAQSVAWLPGGGVLATGNGGDVRAWSDGNAAETVALDGFANPAAGGRALCVSADGTLVAGTAPGGAVRVVATATGVERAKFDGMVAPLAFEGDEVWLLTQQATLERRSLTGEAAGARPVKLPFDALQGALSVRTGRMVFSDRGGVLGVVSLTGGGAPVTRDSGHTAIWWLAISNDGKLVATGGRDSCVRLWRADTLELVREWRAARPAVNGSFSPDDRWLVWGQNNGDAGVREVAGEGAHTIATSSSVLQAVTFHPRAPRLFLGGREGIVHVVDTRDWREQIDLHGALPGRASGVVVRAAASADGNVLAGYLEEGVLRVWRAAPRSLPE